MGQKVVLSLVFLLVLTGSLFADYPGSAAGIVKVNYAKVDGTTITSLAKAAGSAATVSDSISISRSSDHSIGVSLTCTQTVSVTVSVLGSFDKVNYTAFPTAVAAEYTATGNCQIIPVAIPVCPYVKLSIGSDATYPVTLTAVTLCSW